MTTTMMVVVVCDDDDDDGCCCYLQVDLLDGFSLLLAFAPFQRDMHGPLQHSTGQNTISVSAHTIHPPRTIMIITV